MLARHSLAIGLVAISCLATPAFAQLGADSIKGVLGKASDLALDKLSKPGAFSADDAIRISLPGAAKGLDDLMKVTDQAGLTSDISGSLNRAAEQAAAQAKPIFRSAIDKATLKDAVGIAKGGDTGATDYLKETSNTEIVNKLKPLIGATLEKAGVMKQVSQLSAVGMDGSKLTDYVSQKTADGIFTYMGREETTIRKDPIGTGKDLLQGVKF
jgi:hypothetical protein